MRTRSGINYKEIRRRADRKEKPIKNITCELSNKHEKFRQLRI